MKGILGRKVGMTQVFSEQGRSIPVTVVEIGTNVVTQVLTLEQHGYNALQLAAFDRREKTSTKPLIGHYAKAKTGPKRFSREIRNMSGYAIGDKITGEIFAPGVLVDVQGTSKGHGFQGTIKRNNQKIGPRSHGGGGGSQPIRQTGSLGDMVSNRVFKNMTMPGHMGVDKVSVQNLEVITYDEPTQSLLIKGSIPGPKKGFVIIREAVKGLPASVPTKLVNVQEALAKNHLLEEAKRFGADINTTMSVNEMRAAIEAAQLAREAEAKAAEANALVAKLAEDEAKAKAAAEEARRKVEEAKAQGNVAEAAAAEAAAEKLDRRVEQIEEKEQAAKSEAVEAEAAAKAAEAKAEALQVEVEAEAEEESKSAKDDQSNKGGQA